jgi:hypothetical protein
MHLKTRIRSLMAALGPNQLTPGPSYFVTNARGRWPTDSVIGPHAPAYLHRRHPDGTVDLVGLNCSDATDEFTEGPGTMARDFAIVQAR